MNENLLRENGLKVTNNRLQILELLQQSSAPMTAEEIYLKLRENSELNVSTAYRILSAFEEKRIVLKHQGCDSKAYYQLFNETHKHYIICSECKTRVDVTNCPLCELEKRLEKETGYEISGHRLEFVGKCPQCQKQENL